jgi:radical SAM-linked protein
MRLFSRAVRRAALPILYSQGFNPRPQISFGPPPAVGVESESEYADLMLARPMSPRELVARLNQNLIAGVQVLQAEIIDPKARSLMSRIEVADYAIEIRLDGACNGMATKDRLQKGKLKKFVASLTKTSDKVIEARLESLSGSTALLRILGRAGNQGSFKPLKLADLWKEKFAEEGLVLEKVKRVGLYYYRGGELKDLFEI